MARGPFQLDKLADLMMKQGCMILLILLMRHIRQFEVETRCLAYDLSFYFKQDILVLFLPNSYGTSEFPDCGNLVGEDCMGNLRWANTEPSMHFRKTNTDPFVHFRKANTDLSMHFRKANTEVLLLVLLPTPYFTSKFTPSFIPNITINLLHHDECNIISHTLLPSPDYDNSRGLQKI